MCVDNFYKGIDTPQDFVDYISNQITTENPLIAYLGISSSSCLTWPDFASLDVERYTGPFPSALNNKLLVIGITGDSIAWFDGYVPIHWRR